MKKLFPKLAKIGREYLVIILLCVGIAMTVVPLLTPEHELLVAVAGNENAGYLTAVSASKFLGFRYGIIIGFGMMISAFALYCHFNKSE